MNFLTDPDTSSARRLIALYGTFGSVLGGTAIHADSNVLMALIAMVGTVLSASHFKESSVAKSESAAQQAAAAASNPEVAKSIVNRIAGAAQP